MAEKTEGFHVELPRDLTLPLASIARIRGHKNVRALMAVLVADYIQEVTPGAFKDLRSLARTHSQKILDECEDPVILARINRRNRARGRRR